MLEEKDFEVKSFPCLFPDGKNGKDAERDVKLNDQDYWGQRILNVDDRCGSCPPYVFSAAFSKLQSHCGPGVLSAIRPAILLAKSD